MKDPKGIAGVACGGDILFYELCQKMNIPSEKYLALPLQKFKKESVSFAGKNWEDHYDLLISKIPDHTLPGGKEKIAIVYRKEPIPGCWIQL
ncbi:MAG: hypothetical protein ABI550_08305 [Ignavibacteriaceae bacterium]